MNQPGQQEERFEENETFVVENTEAIEEIKIEILEEFLKTQQYEHRRARDTSEARNKQKNKLNIRIGNLALDQMIKGIKSKYITTLNELTYLTAKAITE